MSNRIVHLTSAHRRYDTRIFLKECRSLAAAGYDVSLIVADGLPEEVRDGVRIIGVAKANGRLGRMVGSTRAVLKQALTADADLYHLHDPELLLIAGKLLRSGKHVIFDAHEDLPKQVLSKSYLWKPTRKLVAGVVQLLENFAFRRMTAVVGATPAIRDKFRQLNPLSVDIYNYPLRNELISGARNKGGAGCQVCYVGGMSSIRGIHQIVTAVGMTRSDVRLAIAGGFVDRGLADGVRLSHGWYRVDELGQLGRDDVRNLMAESIAGLVTYLPAPNHIEAQPNKLFEYMSAGLPVVASDFPLWREIVESNDCGICVNPLDPAAIADAIDWLVTHPDEASRMGENGRRAVERQYNWEVEEKKLVGLYRELLNGDMVYERDVPPA